MTDTTIERSTAPASPRVFRPKGADKGAWKGVAAAFVLFLLLLCAGLAVFPSQWLELALIMAPIVPWLGWVSYQSSRHRKDRFEVDESQIVYVGLHGHLALAWHEIGEIEEHSHWLILRPKGRATDRTLKIPYRAIVESSELFALIHRYCRAARRASGDLARLPQVLLKAWVDQLGEGIVTGVLLVLACFFLWISVPVLALVFLAAAGVFPLLGVCLPSAMVVSTKGVVMLCLWRSETLRHDEIDEILLTRRGVAVRSGDRRPFRLDNPRGGCLAAYDILLSAWESAREGREQVT